MVEEASDSGVNFLGTFPEPNARLGSEESRVRNRTQSVLLGNRDHRRGGDRWPRILSRVLHVDRVRGLGARGWGARPSPEQHWKLPSEPRRKSMSWETETRMRWEGSWWGSGMESATAGLSELQAARELGLVQKPLSFHAGLKEAALRFCILVTVGESGAGTAAAGTEVAREPVGRGEATVTVQN